MHITFETFILNKRFPLTISRGTTSHTTNIWVKLQEDGIEGWGEASPFSVVKGKKEDTETLLTQLARIALESEKYSPWQRQSIERVLLENKISSSVKAAIDMALYDWMGKAAGLPLWRLWGLEIDRIVPISVTIGINSPEGAKLRVKAWQDFIDAKILKIKLGNPEGIAADRAMFLAIREQAPDAEFTVDANGGWNLDDALTMCDWLADRGVKYVEQPLAVGEEDKLSVLHQRSPLPIFVDESCFNSSDIPHLSKCVSGINIKIMKAGGLTEVMRAIDVAKACGLKIMFGCYSDSILANTAMSHLAPLANYLDLDSHLNSSDDPFIGAELHRGCLLPKDLPGLGVEYRANRCRR
jgi:L-Ala-D/L-Glu epimerase